MCKLDVSKHCKVSERQVMNELESEKTYKESKIYHLVWTIVTWKVDSLIILFCDAVYCPTTIIPEFTGRIIICFCQAFTGTTILRIVE